MKNQNISLIGMPGSGKSTLGKAIAHNKKLNFLDVDQLIEQRENAPLQSIVDQRGWRKLREIEAEVICSLYCEDTVISTGGSAVYSSQAMQHLRNLGHVVFLDISFNEMQLRLGKAGPRGLAKPETQTLEQLYNERRALYLRHASIKVNTEHKSISEACNEIMHLCG